MRATTGIGFTTGRSLKAASTLRLNTIDEARETVRAWAETAWDALGINQGGGRMQNNEFIPMPIPNPYAKPKVAAT